MLCKATGRTVTLRIHQGERLRRSNVWVRIVGSPGLEQYATLTYAQASGAALSALPTCDGK